MSIFLTLPLNLLLFFSLIIFDSLQPWKYIFVYTYAANADFFFLQKAICSFLSWSSSLWKLRCFSFHSVHPAGPLTHHQFFLGPGTKVGFSEARPYPGTDPPVPLRPSPAPSVQQPAVPEPQFPRLTGGEED